MRPPCVSSPANRAAVARRQLRKKWEEKMKQEQEAAAAEEYESSFYFEDTGSCFVPPQDAKMTDKIAAFISWYDDEAQNGEQDMGAQAKEAKNMIRATHSSWWYD